MVISKRTALVRVSPHLVREKVAGHDVLERALAFLEEDDEVQTYLNLCNDMVVKRLFYNDHGPVHSRIVAGAALEIMDILSQAGVKPTLIAEGEYALEDAKLVVLLGAYLHDIGNMIHRDFHHITGTYLALGILGRCLPLLYDERKRILKLQQEVLHCVLAHDESLRALSVEAGVVKLADGTDMAEGRARVPYRAGKSDIHSVSALAIRRVDILRGRERPIEVVVTMDNEAGLFQVEEVYGRKIATSGLAQHILVKMKKGGRLFKVFKLD
jgi:metal-dependent HD superfamily phosphatase/phosphodiesterase